MPPVFRPAPEARAEIESCFPNLTNTEWLLKSPGDDNYQCIAWAACRTDCHMWPNQCYIWFPGLPLAIIPEAAPVNYFVEGFARLGYEPCGTKAFEFGYQKVAIYANDLGPTHMARQHFWGRGWLSKPGVLEDILHRELADVEGDMSKFAGQYGRVAQILKRNWWIALRFGLLRGWWAALKFWLYRLSHPSWIWNNIRSGAMKKQCTEVSQVVHRESIGNARPGKIDVPLR